VVVSIVIATSARAASWTEIGDAGGPTSPQVTQGTGSLSSIVGSRGGAADPSDAFLFATNGVSGLRIFALVSPSFQSELVTLYDSAGALLQFGLPDLNGLNLAAGSYVIRVSAFEAESPDSPPHDYSIRFTQAVAFAQAPEPGVVLLTAVALLLVRSRR
jgi:hypothetical protein